MPHFQSCSVEDSHTTTDPSLLSLPRSKSVPPVSPLLNHDGLPENPLGCFADLTQPWAATFTYPSPSASESSFDGTSTPLVQACKARDAFPFPHQSTNAKERSAHPPIFNASCGRPERRCYSGRTRLRTPLYSPDRFIPKRRSPLSSTRSFQLSKPADSLSGNEKLLRQRSASPDPFSPRTPSRMRDNLGRFPLHRPIRALRSGTASGSDVLSIRTQPLAQSNRQASFGAVWNVGGTTAAMIGPVTGIPDGRGGFLSSGTNAPMYTSQFLEGDSPDQDLERHERRLAAALDIDQANKILGAPISPQFFRCEISSSGTKRKWIYDQGARTVWRDNEWVKDGAPLRKLSSETLRLCSQDPFRAFPEFFP